MAKKRRKFTFGGVVTALMGFLCALVLGALFYGTMVYQLAGEQKADAQAQTGGVLALMEGSLLEEETLQQPIGGVLCSVVTRSYALADGTRAYAITASPAAYLERLSQPGVQMQLITGFVIDDLDAVYAINGDTGILAARSGENVYMIECAADQQTLYALGAGARRTQ